MGGNDAGQKDEKVNGEKVLPESATSKYTTDNVSRMVERLLTKETTFFDHYRLKNLGGKIENASGATFVSPDTQKNQVFPFNKGGQGNGNGHGLTPAGANGSSKKAGTNGGSNGSAKGPPLARGEDGGSVTGSDYDTQIGSVNGASGESNKTSQSPLNRLPTDLSEGGQTEGEKNYGPPGKGRFFGRKITETLGGLSKEPRWLTSLKWLTRLFFSFIVLAWMFVLGFIVGRVTLTEDENELAEKIQSSALGSFLGLNQDPENLAALQDEIEPLDSDYPIVIVSPDSLAQNEPPQDPPPLPQSEAPIDLRIARNESPTGQAPMAQTPAANDNPKPAPETRSASAAAQPAPGQSAPGEIIGTAPSQASKAPSPAGENKPRAASQERPQTPSASAETGLNGRGGPITPESSQSPDAARGLASVGASIGASIGASLGASDQAKGTAVGTGTGNETALGRGEKKDAGEDYFWPAKPTKKGLFTIQVGAVGNEEAAKAMVKKFTDLGFEDVYFYRTSSGRFNVRVGRYETEIQGKTAAVALSVAGAHQPYLSKLNP
ncbi:MAG: SPOR domain-containing protein [Deltaproteobacteria bacterium]|jgi:hypothetical protein|nr:SPOR domain-containing protein [Deltaproteobacteria bacterium]